MQHWVTGFLHTTTTLLLAYAVMGCSENNVSLFIRSIPKPDAATCITLADPGAAMESSPGRLDKLFRSRYANPLLIGNQLLPRGDDTTLRPESSRVQFYEAEVTVFDFAGASLPGSPFTVPTAGFVNPAEGIQPSWGVANVLMIPPQVLDLLPTSDGEVHSLIIRSKVFGTTLGGQDVSTGYWDWPVEVCQTTPVGNCIGSFTPVEGVAEETPCKIGQDDPLDPRTINRGLCKAYDTPLGKYQCTCDPAAACPGLESE